MGRVKKRGPYSPALAPFFCPDVGIAIASDQRRQQKLTIPVPFVCISRSSLFVVGQGQMPDVPRQFLQ